MRVAFDGRRAIGVEVDLGGDDTLLLARRTILSAGAFGTPSLLMRSGVGPQEHLRTRGVAVVHHLAGVGRNLMDHPYAGISQHLPRGSRLPAMDRHHIPVVWRFSSGHEGCPDGDMHMGFIGRVAWHAMGRRIGALAFWVNKSFSRGHVTLAAQPGDPPDIDLRLLSDPRDRARLRDAFRMAAGLAADIAATGQAGPPLPARLSDRARRFGPKTTGNALLMGLAAAAVDLAGPFAPRLSAALSYAGPSLADLLADEAALDRYLDESVTGVWHPCGTCRMGRADDPLSVTDPSGRVHGIDDLFICDASLFPSIPRANLNIPVIMTAERIADLLRSRSLT
jgi:5-(hydroxymethyl)furfural/furfural oxidase